MDDKTIGILAVLGIGLAVFIYAIFAERTEEEKKKKTKCRNCKHRTCVSCYGFCPEED